MVASAHRNRETWFGVQGFREGLVFKDHRLLNHPTLVSRVTEKKKKFRGEGLGARGFEK